MDELNEDNYIVTFHFSSGENMDIIYTKEKLNILLIALAQGWNDFNIMDDEFGINFSHMSHYKIKKG